MADFPSTLPSPLLAGYSLDPMTQTIRTDMEVGAPRVRRRTAFRLDTASVMWNFSEAELTTFRDWFDNATTGAAGGAAWFNVTLRSAGGEVACQARFSGDLSMQFVPGPRWNVSAKLEVRYA